MNAIDVADLHKSYGPRVILKGVGFTVGENEKVGVVGRNGSGKSTLFRILAGVEDPDQGRISRKKGLDVGYLPQVPVLDPGLSIRQTLEGRLGEAREKTLRYQMLTAQMTHVSCVAENLLAEQEELQNWLDLHGAWSLDHRIEEICERFDMGDIDRPVGTLSGGWSQRTALAGILLSSPDLILLDEPTNQLDAETISWLEEQLKSYHGAVLLITHDRYFLDRVAGRMFDLENGSLAAYTGGYSDYLRQRDERLQREGQEQKRLLNLLRREEAWLSRGAKARTTKQKARIDRVEKLRGQKTASRQRDLSIDLVSGARLGSTILTADNLTAEINGTVLFRDLSLIMRKGEKIGVIGPNGCGKTTLLRTLMGEIEPAGGKAVLGKNTKIGYLDQKRSGLDPDVSVADALSENDWVAVGAEKRHKISYLEDFLFSPPEQRKRVSTLSGGERARLLLAKMVLEGANLLVLDEPTNDLDIPTLQVLDETLASFEGCLLLVTHDRYFLDRVATSILSFEKNGKATLYEGNYEIYLKLRNNPAKTIPSKSKKEEAQKAAKAAPAKKKKGLAYKEKKKLEELEQEIDALEQEKNKLVELLADPMKVDGGADAFSKLSAEFTALEESLNSLFTQWEELEEKRIN